MSCDPLDKYQLGSVSTVVDIYQHFKGLCCLHILGPDKGGSSSTEVALHIYQPTMYHIPGDSYGHTTTRTLKRPR
jgi:hypothetical protein